MRIVIGDKIRELRRRDGRTQEELAGALGVTSQAVSRWEAGGGYPDMEMVPSIANYFGVSIDVLFGFNPDRERKIQEIIDRIDAYELPARPDGCWLDECIEILREGLAEFPREQRLLLKLADTLSTAGWRRNKEWVYYDEEGYMRHDYDRHKENAYWKEAVKICENLVDTAGDNRVVAEAVSILVPLCRNLGEYGKAAAYAARMPELRNSREILLAGAADMKEEAGYIGDALMKMADSFAEQMVYGLINYRPWFQTDLPLQKVKGVISLFYLVCDDGNFGKYHDILIRLYLYLSRLQWERGYHDDAFASLYEALKHAKALEEYLDGEEHSFTAPLLRMVKCEPGMPERKPGMLKKIAATLPEDWPWWCNPDYTQVEKEMKADPRWAEWVEQTRA